MNPCVKCGEKDNVHTRWLPDAKTEPNAYTRRRACEATSAEHLHRSCRTCHFEWCEPTADAVPKQPEPKCKRCGDTGFYNGNNPPPGAYGFRLERCGCKTTRLAWTGPLERPTAPVQLALPFTDFLPGEDTR